MYSTHNITELHEWPEGMEIVRNICQYFSNLTHDENFDLNSQLDRCSESLPAKIAEDSGRITVEFERFLRVSPSSSYELETLLLINNELCEKVNEEIFQKNSYISKQD